MKTNIELYSAEWPTDSSQSYPDFQLGNIRLSLHLGIEDEVGVLAVGQEYAKQLLLIVPSELKTGRVPLYVCRCCADLGCGATTVRVAETEDSFIWSDFAYEGNSEDEIIQSEYMKRTGPFTFDKEEYISVIKPYSKR